MNAYDTFNTPAATSPPPSTTTAPWSAPHSAMSRRCATTRACASTTSRTTRSAWPTCERRSSSTSTARDRSSTWRWRRPARRFSTRLAGADDMPFNETRSYGQLAKQLGTSPRAMGGANGSNRICLIVPCHRVIGSDGSLTGFAYGTEIKRRCWSTRRASPPGVPRPSARRRLRAAAACSARSGAARLSSCASCRRSSAPCPRRPGRVLHRRPRAAGLHEGSPASRWSGGATGAATRSSRL